MPIDRSKYPPNWKKISEFIRFHRAKNKCEECGVENHTCILRGEYNGKRVYQDSEGNIYDEKTSEYITSDYVGEVCLGADDKSIKIVLTVAHLDHDTSNNSFFNLKAMCQKCHNNYDKEYRLENRRETMRKKKGQAELF